MISKLHWATVVVAVAGCGGPQTQKKQEPATTGPSAIERKLVQHVEWQKELRQAADLYAAAAADYETKKAAHLAALAAELGKSKKTAGLGSTVATMGQERSKVADELNASLRQLHDHLLARAKGQSDLMATEAKLLEVEIQAFDGSKSAAARAQLEISQFHDASTAFHVAQKAQQSTLAALVAKEFEFNALVQEDPQAREQADRQLGELRADLEKRYGVLITSSKAYEDAATTVHSHLEKELPPKQAPLGARLKELIALRASQAEAVMQSRVALRDAVLKRAEQRSREIAFDGEITAVLYSAFKDPAQRDSFLIRARDPRDAASAAFVAAKNAELSLAEVRRRIVTLEADIASLGY